MLKMLFCLETSSVFFFLILKILKIHQHFFEIFTNRPAVLKINTILKILQTSNSIYNVFIYAGMYKGFVENAWKVCKRVKQYTVRRKTVRRRRLANDRRFLGGNKKYNLSVRSENNRLSIYSQTSPDKMSTDDAWI